MKVEITLKSPGRSMGSDSAAQSGRKTAGRKDEEPFHFGQQLA